MTARRATIDKTATGVRGMDTSLGDAKAAVDRASSIATGVGDTMGGLAQAMQVNIFGLQPLAGLSGGFTDAATQLGGAVDRPGRIGASLDSNRDDAAAVAQSLDDLSTR